MDNRIREGIEACRAGSDDLRAADLADAAGADVAAAVDTDAQARLAYERVQGWDAAIGASMEKVAVPVDLAERILARLNASNPSSELLSSELLAGAVGEATHVEPPTDEACVSLPAKRAGWSRRHWVGASALGLGAAGLVIAAGYWLAQGSDQPLEVLAERWHAELSDEWQAPDRAPKDFPAPLAVRVAPARWQWIGRFTPTPVVAYELVHPNGSKAMLYVADLPRAGLPGAPPVSPQWRSGGRAVGYWRSGNKVCVLVVPDERAYRAFVQPSAAPLA